MAKSRGRSRGMREAATLPFLPGALFTQQQFAFFVYLFEDGTILGHIG